MHGLSRNRAFCQEQVHACKGWLWGDICSFSEGCYLSGVIGAPGAQKPGRAPVHFGARPQVNASVELPANRQLPLYAARRRSMRCQISTSALVRATIMSWVWAGPGVKRRRSVPRGTVGKLIGWT